MIPEWEFYSDESGESYTDESGESYSDVDSQVLIQCRDRTNTAFFGFEMAVLTAGQPLPLGEGHEGTPAIHIDLRFCAGFRVQQRICWFEN